MTGGHYRSSTRQSGIHAHPQSTVTLLVTFVSVQTPPEFGQRVELPAVYAHFRARVGLHHIVDRTVPPLGYRLGPREARIPNDIGNFPRFTRHN